MTAPERVTILGGADVGLSAEVIRHDWANDGESLAWIRIDGRTSHHVYPVSLLAPVDQVPAFAPTERANARGFLFDLEVA